MVIRRSAKRLSIAAVLVAVVVASAASPYLIKNTSAVSRACKNSPECMAAVAREQEANKNAASSARSANFYQAKVNELYAEIARKESEIAQTEAEANALSRQIEETTKKLEEQQEALAELLINMHFEGDAEPITILAGSKSISDLAEKQAREEVIKQEISVAAEKVKQTKEQLEADRQRVEDLLVLQRQAKTELQNAKAEQESLVTKYANDAEAFTLAAKEAQAAQREAERREQEAHPELYRGMSYNGFNTYEWQADCPGRQDDYSTYIDGRPIGGYVCECVSYVGWKAYEYFGLYLSWGNAYSWDDNARAWGYRVDNIPAANTIGQTDAGYWGHVFWVESVNADGSINVTEYNNAWATQLYSGSYHYGDFGSRTIPASEVWQYNFIHFE